MPWYIFMRIKKLQNVMFEILLEFDRICKKNNIKYQLFAGTLLGSIRHKGFIPWDDDIDICLLRKEYNRFIEVCKTDLDSKYFLQTYETDKHWPRQFAKIRKNNTLLLEDSVSDYDIHHGIFIDVFPLDNVFPNTFIGKMQQKILFIMTKISLIRIKKICMNREGFMEKFLCLFIHPFSKIIPKYWLDLLQTKIAIMFQKQETEYVAHLTCGKEVYMNIKDVYDVIDGIFNDHIFPIPKNYDKVLTGIFGNYMKPPPIEERGSHNFIKISFDTSVTRTHEGHI